MPRVIHISPDERLRDCKERPLNVHVALPLHGRLDALLDIVEEETGSRPFRRELVAALILAAPEGAKDLEDLLRRFRTATAGDAALEEYSPDNVLAIAKPRRGRRPSR